jgi:hypothetical protein
VREDGSLRPVLDRFVQRVMKRSGRLDPAAVEDVLERAAFEIDALSQIEPRKGASHVRKR